VLAVSGGNVITGGQSYDNDDPVARFDRHGYSDNFTVSGNVVPEPSTWALMLVSFGLLGGAGYWTRRRSVAPKLSSAHPRRLSPPEGLARRPGSPRAEV
jgi:hypothetical protein